MSVDKKIERTLKQFYENYIKGKRFSEIPSDVIVQYQNLYETTYGHKLSTTWMKISDTLGMVL